MDFHYVNRIEIESAEWNSREDRLRKLFKSSPSIEKSLSKEKLRWCERILVKYGKTDHLEEQSALYIIKNERSYLIKQVYSNKYGQFFYKVLNLLILKKVNAKIQVRDELKSNRSLVDKLKLAGFSSAFNKAEHYMRLGQQKFTVPVSYYLNEKERIEHSLSFKKDDLGYYEFKGFTSRLHDHSRASEYRKHYFSEEQGNSFNSVQAYNLLSGRAVFHEESWRKLSNFELRKLNRKL